MLAEASRVNIEKKSESHLDVHPGGARVTTVRPSVQQPVRPDTRASADTHVLTPAVGLPSLQARGTTLSPCKCPGLGLGVCSRAFVLGILPILCAQLWTSYLLC